ncbi:MAG: hypothetical protein HYX69_02765 [Planctomycetia bacterium]|nr:hypothetical protein [Planctomycetia bacterium]
MAGPHRPPRKLVPPQPVPAATAEFQEAMARRYAAEASARETAAVDKTRDRLARLITEFDTELDDSEEVGMQLASFGQTVVFRIEEIGYLEPSLLIFSGESETGGRVRLVQHVSQLSFLLVALKRSDPSEPKKPLVLGYAAGPTA